jgi:hypothetical protein
MAHVCFLHETGWVPFDPPSWRKQTIYTTSLTAQSVTQE